MALHSFSVSKCGEICRSPFGPFITNCHQAAAGLTENTSTAATSNAGRIAKVLTLALLPSRTTARRIGRAATRKSPDPGDSWFYQLQRQPSRLDVFARDI